VSKVQKTNFGDVNVLILRVKISCVLI